MQTWRLQEITYKLVKESRYDVAVLPIGSTEPHNLHMPYGTDAITVTAVADRACERASQAGGRVILLPTIPYGVNTNLLEFPLTISVTLKALSGVLTEIVHSLDHHGIRKLILLNGHGGNECKAFLRDIHGQTGVFITAVDWWKIPNDIRREVFEEDGDHADEMETSVGLYLFPDLVHPEDADAGTVRSTRFDGINAGWAAITRPWHLLTTNSGVGDPRKGTREKGERFVEVAVDRLARFITELSNAEMDGTFPY
ncbi:MAG: creatininase family protein [Candidatus Latescibacteria bacterium]|nr:creatininase family protein [Candidatus Latescibacterota bacterium]